VIDDTDREISQTITLPVWMWDRLTESEKGFDREIWDDPALPDMPLAERIDLFLQVEVARWRKSIADDPEAPDLDDGVPF
jgi:hypothetical protein